MFFEEKVDLVKKRFPQPEFKDPFQSGGKIIQKIIRQFHNSSPMKFYQSTDRESLIKDCFLIKQCNSVEFYKTELEKLDEFSNYWLFLVYESRIYDCQKAALQFLLYLLSGQKQQEFYISFI